jgi:hypothetical protein
LKRILRLKGNNSLIIKSCTAHLAAFPGLATLTKTKNAKLSEIVSG